MRFSEVSNLNQNKSFLSNSNQNANLNGHTSELNMNLNLTPNVPDANMTDIQKETIKTLVEDDQIVSNLRKANVTITNE